MREKIIPFILSTIFLFMANSGFSQDPNLSRVYDFRNYSIDFDSTKKYYPAFQIHYDDTLAGFALTNYHGYDTLGLHIDYMSSFYVDNQRVLKGIGYAKRPEGTFFDIAFYDWSGDKHGNQMTFYLDGSVKLNEVWDRGKLLRHWQYNEKGELEEYKEFK